MRFSTAYQLAALRGFEGEGVTALDYIAISVLIVLAVWIVAHWIPRGKL